MNSCFRACLILVTALPLFHASALIGGDDGWQDHFDAGNTAYDRCELDKAENRLRKALETAARSETPDWRVVLTLNALAKVILTKGAYVSSEQILNRARAINETWIGKENAEMAETLDLLGFNCTRQNDCRDAESYFQAAFAMREKLLGPDHPDVSISLSHLGELRTRQGKFAEAESLLNRALRIREKAYGPQDPSVAATLEDLAVLRAAQENYAAADPLFRRSLEIFERTMGKDHCELVLLLKHYATTLRKLHRDTEAEALEARSMTLVKIAP